MESFSITRRIKPDIARIAIGFIILTGVFLRMLHFMDSLWYDEVWYSTRVVMKDIQSIINNIFLDKAAPLYYVCMFLWTKIFGDSVISIRIIPLLSGIISLYLTYLLAMKTTNRKTAIFACFLLCIAPVHIWYSREASPYSTLLAVFLLTLFSFYKIKEHPSVKKWYIIYFVTFLSAVFTHWFAAVYVVAISLMCLFKKDTVKRNILIQNAVILFILTTFLFLKMRLGHIKQFTNFLRPFTLSECWHFFFNWLTFGNSLLTVDLHSNTWRILLRHPGILLAQIFVLLIFTRGIVAIARASDYPHGKDILWYVFSLPLYMLVLTYLGCKEIYIERYLYIVSPFFFIILTQGIIGLKRGWIRIYAFILILAICFTALVSFFVKQDKKRTVAGPKEDLRSVARYFLHHTLYPRQTLLIFTNNTENTINYVALRKLVLLYYLAHKNHSSFIPKILCLEINRFSCEKLKSRQIQAFYFLYSNGAKEFWERNLMKKINCQQTFSLVDAKSFNGLELRAFNNQNKN